MYLESIQKQNPLSHRCWILLPPFYYKFLLQPVTQTESFQTTISMDWFQNEAILAQTKDI